VTKVNACRRDRRTIAAQEVTMSARRMLGLAALLAVFIASPARAASGYDVSDVWWNPAESGWGLELTQHGDTAYATLYVYDASRRPTWYASALAFQGLTPQTREVNFAGDLYESAGPSFATVPFTPSSVTRRRVGAMQLRSPDLVRATITYTVDGITIQKDVERLTLRIDDYAGDYVASFSVTSSRCTNPADDGTQVSQGTMQIVQSPGAMSLTVNSNARTCTYAGPYEQNGRLGRLSSQYQCSSGEVGALVFEEMNVQRFGVMGRLWGTDTRGCHMEGRFAAARP
jgi:hypothetical protein